MLQNPLQILQEFLLLIKQKQHQKHGRKSFKI